MRQLQQLASRRLREIVRKRNNEPIDNDVGKIINVDLVRKHCIPTVYTQLRKEIRNIYRWETTLSPEYLNNIIDMGNVLKTRKLNWYRM